MSSSSKTKGNYLENKTALIIREVFNIDARYVKRSASSGVRNDDEGDLSILHPEFEKVFPFIIECKNREEIKFKFLLGEASLNKSNPFIKYIKQNELDLKDTDKSGLIVFSKSYEEIYCLIYQIDKFSKLVNIDEFNKNIQHLFTNISGKRCLVYPFKKFLELYKESLNINFDKKG